MVETRIDFSESAKREIAANASHLLSREAHDESVRCRTFQSDYEHQKRSNIGPGAQHPVAIEASAVLTAMEVFDSNRDGLDKQELRNARDSSCLSESNKKIADAVLRNFDAMSSLGLQDAKKRIDKSDINALLWSFPDSSFGAVRRDSYQGAQAISMIGGVVAGHLLQSVVTVLNPKLGFGLAAASIPVGLAYSLAGGREYEWPALYGAFGFWGPPVGMAVASGIAYGITEIPWSLASRPPIRRLYSDLQAASSGK